MGRMKLSFRGGKKALWKQQISYPHKYFKGGYKRTMMKQSSEVTFVPGGEERKAVRQKDHV